MAYDNELTPLLARQKTAEGLSWEQLADYFNIDIETLLAWEAEHPAFREALAGTPDVLDAKVEQALLSRALGFSYDEVTEEESDDIVKKRRTVRKQVLPDLAAQVYWLKNRHGKRWSDKPETEDKADALMIAVGGRGKYMSEEEATETAEVTEGGDV